MRIEETSHEIKKENRTVHTIYYYTDAGREIAFFKDDGKNQKFSKVLYFNSSLLKNGYDNNYLGRAKPEYKNDIEAVVALHPGIPQSEYMNV